MTFRLNEQGPDCRDDCWQAQWSAITRHLGCDESAKLLLIHADDLGMASAVNKATFEALQQQAVSSASVMVPCPWFPEVAEYAASHPRIDLGVHLTLTSEWEHYEWKPVSCPSLVQSLLHQGGSFWKTGKDLAAHALPQEVTAELEAQVHRALWRNLGVTHLDSHMFTLLLTPSLLQVFYDCAYQHKLPLRITKSRVSAVGNLTALRTLSTPLDACFEMKIGVQGDDWLEYYQSILKMLEPGLNELIVHLGYDCDELRAMMGTDSPWGSKWRQRDFDVVTSADFKRALAENDIRVIKWRELRTLAWPEERAHSAD